MFTQNPPELERLLGLVKERVGVVLLRLVREPEPQVVVRDHPDPARQHDSLAKIDLDVNGSNRNLNII